MIDLNPMPVSRRSFNGMLLGSALLSPSGHSQTIQGITRQVTEFSFTSGKAYGDPFAEVELDVDFEGPGRRRIRVPAFWAGEQQWRVRFAAPEAGSWTWRTSCSDTANSDLHGRKGSLKVAAYAGNHPLFRHGSVRVAADRRHFEHEDGTPFFWLGDTWWMGLCSRLSWPDDFERLTADRVRKGFTVVQIVAGLYPDMPQFDPRGANEAGYPWQSSYTRMNPAYFDMADLRIQHLVANGIVPCIVGCWGYYLPILGAEKMKRHWRYIVARWSALPVIWCLAGEGGMPYYLSKTPDQDSARQKEGWTELARYVHGIDPGHHPITIHPSSSARTTVLDPSVLDFDMLQTGHGDRLSIPNTIRRVRESYAAEPRMPVLVGEVCYEGIQEASRQEVQRFMFWSSILSGAGGHTYGANGLWQVNTADHPFGASPHGRSWGDTPWEVAAELPGSGQLGLAKRFLLRFPWERIEPHPEWVNPAWSAQNLFGSFAAGIPGELRIVFIPDGNSPVMRNLEAGVEYQAFFFNPATGKEYPAGTASADASGSWKPPQGPIFQDWVLVLTAGTAAR